MGIPWTARRSNQSILKEINPDFSLEDLLLKLKLQYFGYLMQRADSLERANFPNDDGKDLGQEEKKMTENEMIRWHLQFNGREFEQALGDSEGPTGTPGVPQSMGPQRVGHDLVTEQQQQSSLVDSKL